MGPIRFIEEFRNNYPGSVKRYTLGGCYEFFQILKSQYPQAVALSNNDHVISEIDGLCYDITGIVPKGRSLPIEPNEEKQFKQRP